MQMGQKINPHAMRVGIIKDWDSTWYLGESTKLSGAKVGMIKAWDFPKWTFRMKCENLWVLFCTTIWAIRKGLFF